MTWLGRTTAPASLGSLLALRPELLDLHRDFYNKLWNASGVPPRLLELCRLRVAWRHDCRSELLIRHPAAGVSDADRGALADWHRSERFSDCERAALRLADQVPWQVGDIDDETVAALRRHLADPQVVAVMLALTLFDMHCRLRHGLGVEPPETAEATNAALGTLD
ncbi:MAG TPA: hypothetical protein VMW17_17050 [Candidatus Binatia bacterium]|nr:hypothetical protein [Candidatus Binatia bacterium]